MGLRHQFVFGVVGKHAEDQIVVETYPAQHHVGVCQLEYLPWSQHFQDIGNVLAYPQPENRHILVGDYHLLGQHEISQIEVLDFRCQFVDLHFYLHHSEWLHCGGLEGEKKPEVVRFECRK